MTLAVGLLGIHGALVAAGPVDVDALVRWGAKTGPLVVEAGQAWRLVTANFLHRDWLHLGLNLLVLVAAGGALERMCRRRDYCALLGTAGLATMAGSLGWSAAVSVGASGLVYGCVGALLVLGRRYRGRAAAKARWISGESALPTVLVFLWMGWTSVGVDNAGHLGGLLAGLLLGAFLEPRSAGRGLVRPVGAVLAAGVVAALVVSERSGWRQERDDGFGVAVSVPEGWRGEEDGHGRRTFSNGLPALGRATFSAEVIEVGEPGDGAAQARHFQEEVLVPGVPGPEGRTSKVTGPVEARLGGRAAQRVRAELEGPGGATHLMAFFVPRGEWVYRLVFTWPARYPAYAEVVDRMVAELRFGEPALLREARARALLVPGAPGPLRALGGELRRWGLAEESVASLADAVRLAPSHVETRVELARALFEAGRVGEGCHAAAEAQVYGPSDTGALEAGVRCELARGDVARALARLEEARRVDPQDARLRAAEMALRAVLEAPGRQ
ncbi:rhomboid family intramembrane serine protease [Pyxidicoccus xibeiensis]|uniref:rhomboid family intramembrane serine protease n=1 Tax=Pyxidicoccus xibeiensis TaxID=2906759 RepID=UPI002B1F70A3|nr:rhomboid family intramembrane serine protease [Pyxidicoccus xibeiensis]